MPHEPESVLLNPINTNTPGLIEQSSTLESQNVDVRKWNVWQRLKKVVASDQTWEPSQDVCEREISKSIHIVGTRDQTVLAILRSNYLQIKTSPASPICDDIFRHWIFVGGTRDGTIISQVDTFRVDKDTTVSKVLTNLSQHLLRAPHGSLRTIILSAEARAQHTDGFLSTRHKLVSTFRGRVRSLPFALNDAAALLIANVLKVDKPPGSQDEDFPNVKDPRRSFLQPPSILVPRGNLDFERVQDNHVRLTWQRAAPIFSTDLDVYIWERHKSLPVEQFADIRFYPRTDTDDARIIILFGNLSSLQLFDKFRSDASTYSRSSPANDQIWSVNSEIFFSFAAVVQVIVSETTNFLQESSVEIERMNLLARQNPSTDKMRYLTHLQDCLKSSQSGILHGIQVLDNLLAWINTQQAQQTFWDAGQPFSERVRILRLDMTFLHEQLSQVFELNGLLQQTIREHLELTHNRRNFIVTIVAAIYLPLSFATSFFGMNMNPGTSDGSDGFSDQVYQWIQGAPVDLQNATSALASTIGTSSNLNYSWSVFIITALCLLISLPLLLTLGNIFRAIYRTMTYYASHWRMLVIFPILAFVYFSVDLHVPENSDDLAIVYWTFNGIILLFELFMTFQAWRENDKRMRWTLMTLFTAFCLGLDNSQVNENVPFMVFPWSVFAIYILVGWWEKRRISRSERLRT